IVSGGFTVNGQDLSGDSVGDRIAAGLALVPEDRQRDGMIQALTVGKNLSLASLSSITRNLLLHRRLEHPRNQKSIDDVHIKTSGPSAAVTSLSGGNQQKVVIGKMLQTDPSVILLDEPSRGIDIGAKTEVFHLLAEMAKDGLAVLYSTS